MRRAPLILWSFIAGGVWGVIAYLIGARAVGPSIWPAVLISPLIGVVVGLLVHPRFEADGGWPRLLWSLVSLYLGALLFGLTMGVGDEIRLAGPTHVLGAAIIEDILGVLWWITLTGYILALGPLAYLTHCYLAARLASPQT